MSENILEVRHLKKYFPTKRGLLHAVDDVNFSIKKGTTMGLVGESGCGKSTVGRLILRLTEATDGEILFYDDDIRKYDREKMRHTRRRLQIVFQDPYASLDGRKSIFESIAEPLQVQKIYQNKKEMEENHPFCLVGPGNIDGRRRLFQKAGFGDRSRSGGLLLRRR